MAMRLLPRAAAFAALALASAAASAMTVDYQCIGYRLLQAELNPRNGHIRFEGKDWFVQRVRDSHEARYVDGKNGVTVVARQRELLLTHGGESLKCFLKSDALKQFEPASAPSAAQ